MLNIQCRNFLSDLGHMCYKGRNALKNLFDSLEAFWKSVVNAVYFTVVSLGWMIGVSACVAVSLIMIVYDSIHRKACKK